MNILKSIVAYLGTHARRRMLATAIAMVAVYAFGKTYDIDGLTNFLDLVIGMLGAAWTHNTVTTDDVA